jgi:hypothetical protein
MRYLHLVPPGRPDLERVVRHGLLHAARELRAIGIDDPDAPVTVTEIALNQFMDGALHAHLGWTDAVGLVCDAIDLIVGRIAEKAGKAN